MYHFQFENMRKKKVNTYLCVRQTTMKSQNSLNGWLFSSLKLFFMVRCQEEQHKLLLNKY